MSATTVSRISLVALSLLVGFSSTGCRKDAKAETSTIEAKVHVETAPVSEANAPRYLRLTGTLKGAQQTDLAANVSGRVTKTFVERGTEVKQGALLAQVDTSAASLSLAEARVAVETSKTQQEINTKDCERYEQLRAKGAVTELEYDQITARCKTAPLNLKAAEARASMAAKNVGDGMIRAPFAGVVSERFVEVGTYVQASSRVVSLAQVRDLKIEFSVPEANFPDVKIGSKVSFKVAAYPNEAFEGTVSHIAASMRDTRDFVVEATVPNPEAKLAPGMFADVELEVSKRPLPFIPPTAVFEQNGKSNVFVVNAGILEQRVVQLEKAFEGGFPVRRGLKAGELLVVQYQPTLKNGSKAE